MPKSISIPSRVIGSAWNDVITGQDDPTFGNFFWYHSVAMTGKGTFEDYVYDGMLQANGHNPPYRTPHSRQVKAGRGK